MAFVLIAAIGLAALRNASEPWAGIMLMLAIATVGVALLGSVLSRGRERAWWLGFAVFGGGYLVVAICPIQSELATTWVLRYVHDRVHDQSQYDATLYRLTALRQTLFAAKMKPRAASDTGGIPSDSNDPATVRLLAAQEDIRRRIKTLESRLQVLRGPNSAGISASSDSGAIEGEELPVNRWRSLLPGAANLDAFQRVGHSLFALLVDLIGGAIGFWFWERSNRREAGSAGGTAGGGS
jgi:hypothetical protein